MLVGSSSASGVAGGEPRRTALRRVSRANRPVGEFWRTSGNRPVSSSSTPAIDPSATVSAERSSSANICEGLGARSRGCQRCDGSVAAGAARLGSSSSSAKRRAAPEWAAGASSANWGGDWPPAVKRGSLSSSSGSPSGVDSPVPSPTMLTYPPSGMMPSMYVVSPHRYEQNGMAGPNPMLNVSTRMPNARATR